MTQLGGTATCFFLFDVADAIDLERARALISDAVRARLTPKPATPPYVQYAEPPIAIHGSAVEAANVAGFDVRLKVFDYGVISVAFSRPLPATWEALLDAGLRWSEDPQLPTEADRLCRHLMTRLSSAASAPREAFLTEDYWVFAATAVAGSPAAEAVVAQQGGTLAQLLRGERAPLSPQEREEVLRHRLSYLEDDLVVPTWNGAFVYDTEAGAQAALDIIEHANSQLLQFRYYDQLLDTELGRIYARLQHPPLTHTWLGRRHTRAARQLHAIFIDV
ncbi:MAG: hypothetical protein AB7P99_17760, partial [Vicinamibacterales bacterium]